MASEARSGGLPGHAFETLALGLGNVLWADEGMGIRSMAALNTAYRFPQDVRLIMLKDDRP